MRRPAACCFRTGRIDRAAPFFDIDNLSFFIDHECGTVRHAVVHEHTICLGNGAIFEIAQQGNLDLVLGCKFSLGRNVVAADAEYLGVCCLKFCDTSLVRGEFLGSATSKRGREKRQDDGILAAKIAELHRLPRGGRESEVRGEVALFQMRLRRCLGLCRQSGTEHGTERNQRKYFHVWNPPGSIQANTVMVCLGTNLNVRPARAVSV